jgi:hypothetical protein
MRKTKEWVCRWGKAVADPEKGPQSNEENRDYGKRYRITEMSAMAAEKWAARATLALANRLTQELPAEVSDELVANPTLVGVARAFAILRGLQFPEISPLMDELWDCVLVVEDFGVRDLFRAGSSDDIEEPRTLIELRNEIMQLHVGFTMAASLLNLMAMVALVEAIPISLNALISQAQSPPSSVPSTH